MMISIPWFQKQSHTVCDESNHGWVHCTEFLVVSVHSLIHSVLESPSFSMDKRDKKVPFWLLKSLSQGLWDPVVGMGAAVKEIG